MDDSRPTTSGFLSRPGTPGAFGALMDEYARAAEAFCARAESFDGEAWTAEVPDDDPDSRSPRAVGEHAVYAAFGYSNYLRRALGLPAPSPDSQERKAQRRGLPAPADLRPALAEAIRITEVSGERLRGRDADGDWAREFRVGWGATYNAESLLEHAVCHLLRHRRQLERWDPARPGKAP